MWEVAHATDEVKRSFKNGVLGLTWVETGEAPDWQRLYERREPWHIGTVPSCAEGSHRDRHLGPGPKAASERYDQAIGENSSAAPTANTEGNALQITADDSGSIPARAFVAASW
jgi:hypothetical protein